MQGVEEQKDYELSSNQAAGNSNQDRRVAPVTFSQHFGMDSKPAARPFLVSAPTFISADHSLPSMQQISPTIWHTAQIPPISTPSAFQHVSCPPPNSYNAHQELRPTNPTNASFRASDTLPLLIYQSQSSASIKKSKYLSYFDPMTHENSSTHSLVHSSAESCLFSQHAHQTSEESSGRHSAQPSDTSNSLHPGSVANTSSELPAPPSPPPLGPAIDARAQFALPHQPVAEPTTNATLSAIYNASEQEGHYTAGGPAFMAPSRNHSHQYQQYSQQSHRTERSSIHFQGQHDAMGYLPSTLSTQSHPAIDTCTFTANSLPRVLRGYGQLGAHHQETQHPEARSIHCHTAAVQNHSNYQQMSQAPSSVTRLAAVTAKEAYSTSPQDAYSDSGAESSTTRAMHTQHHDESSFSSASSSVDSDPLLRQDRHHDGKPKRPLNAFMIYSRHRRPTLQRERPELKVREIAQALAEEWRKMPSEEKLFFQDKAKVVKETFHRTYPDYVYSRRANGARNKKKAKTNAAVAAAAASMAAASATPSSSRHSSRRLNESFGSTDSSIKRESDDSPFSPGGYSSSSSSTSSFFFPPSKFSPLSNNGFRHSDVESVPPYPGNHVSMDRRVMQSGGVLFSSMSDERYKPSYYHTSEASSNRGVFTPVDPVVSDLLRPDSSASSVSRYSTL